MADNVQLNLGTGGDIARAKDRGTSIKTTIVGIDMAVGGTESLLDGTVAAPAALMPTGGKIVTITQTPTVGGAAYVAKDAVGGLLTFANAARVSGGTIIVDAVTLVDKSATMGSYDLVLFNATFTGPTDSSAFDPTDAELLTCVGVIPITTWADFNDNSVASRYGLGLSITLAGTSLFGALVARSGFSLTNGDIQVMLAITQN